MPLPRPCFNHSLATTVFDAEAAVIDDCKSDSVCLLLENSRSMDILTPGIAKISQVIRDKIKLGNLRRVSAFEEVNVLKLCEESTITFHHARTFPSEQGNLPLK
jgi:hypothetical protein